MYTLGSCKGACGCPVQTQSCKAHCGGDILLYPDLSAGSVLLSMKLWTLVRFLGAEPCLGCVPSPIIFCVKRIFILPLFGSERNPVTHFVNAEAITGGIWNYCIWNWWLELLFFIMIFLFQTAQDDHRINPEAGSEAWKNTHCKVNIFIDFGSYWD